MVSSQDPALPYRRPQAAELARLLAEPRRFIQVIAGPRQTGKSTLVAQAVEASPVPVRVVSADEPSLRGPEWIAAQWEAARLETGPAGPVAVIGTKPQIGRVSRSPSITLRSAASAMPTSASRARSRHASASALSPETAAARAITS